MSPLAILNLAFCTLGMKIVDHSAAKKPHNNMYIHIVLGAKITKCMYYITKETKLK